MQSLFFLFLFFFIQSSRFVCASKSQSSTHRLLLSNPTKLTGFGSQRIKKSIFLDPALRPKNDGQNATMFIAKHKTNTLSFRSSNVTLQMVSAAENDGWTIEPSRDDHSDESQLWIPVEGIYGVFELPSGIVWVFITSSVDVITAEPWGQIRRVKSLEMVHVASPHSKLSPQQTKEQLRQLRLLRQAMKTHTFYFATGGAISDITQTLQRGLGPNRTTIPDSRFFWNEPAVRPLLDQTPLILQHIIPVSSAFVGIQNEVSLDNKGLVYDEILISRRSRYRAGTRFTKRGADSSGGCANYAETEQICILDGGNTLLSHVQTRGSIPLRWSSPTDIKTYRPKVRIGTDPLAQAKAVQSHLMREWGLYVQHIESKATKLSFVNLIDKKSDQGRLGRAFDAVLAAVLDINANRAVNSKTVKHIWYDFHAEVKHGRWERLEILLKQLTPELKEHGYFQATKEKSGEWSVAKQQNGVLRTNCMDCLDRTNVVQSIFGRYMLFQALASFGKGKPKKQKVPTEFSSSFRLNSLSLPWTEGEVAHRLLWADNADAISRLYAGTPALKGDFTRTGKRTKQGALEDGMNSLQRFYLNNFIDADRQEGMDLMVGHADFAITLTEGDDEKYADLQPIESTKRRADLSLAEAVRAMVNSATDGAETDDEITYLPIHRKRLVGGGLDLRWLPGDLQSHMRASAATPGESLQNLMKHMDRRAASDIPWWVLPDSDEDENNEEDEDEDHSRQSPLNSGHVLAAFIAGLQAPLSTAAAILCGLGFSVLQDEEED